MTSLLPRLINQPEDTRKAVTAIAVGAVGAIALPELSKFVAWIRLHFLHRSKLHRYQHSLNSARNPNAKTPHLAQSDLPNSKAWALVTGASDGIGYGFVQQLAARSFNVILHGRNASKIQNLITKLQLEFPKTLFESFICDATARDSWSEAFEKLVSEITTRNLNLTVLVNNVGGNPDVARSFDRLHEYSIERLNALTDMNAVFPAQITRVLLPILVANKPGLIINMSSMTSVLPIPYLAGYCASKSFNAQFSKALRMELIAEGTGDDIEVLSVLAASVQSAGMKVETSLFVPSSHAFAGSVLGMIGCGREEITGWWSHAVQIWAVGTLMPLWIRDKITVMAGKVAKDKFERELTNKRRE